jgi:hypothetical protein
MSLRTKSVTTRKPIVAASCTTTTAVYSPPKGVLIEPTIRVRAARAEMARDS